MSDQEGVSDNDEPSSLEGPIGVQNKLNQPAGEEQAPTDHQDINTKNKTQSNNIQPDTLCKDDDEATYSLRSADNSGAFVGQMNNGTINIHNHGPIQPAYKNTSVEYTSLNGDGFLTDLSEEEIDLKSQILLTRKIGFVFCLNTRVALNVSEQISRSNFLHNYQRRRFYVEPKDCSQLVEFIESTRKIVTRKPILFILQHYADDKKERYWSSIAEDVEAKRLQDVLSKNNALILQVCYSDSIPAALRHSAEEYGDIFWQIDYVHALLFDYFKGDHARTIEFENYIQSLIKSKLVSRDTFYPSLLSYIKNKTIEVQIEKIKELFSYEVLTAGGEDLHKLVLTVNLDEIGLGHQLLPETDDQLSMAVLYVVSNFQGIPGDEANAILHLLLPRQSFSSGLNNETQLEIPEYDKWISEGDSVNKKLSVELRKTNEGVAGLFFTDVVEGNNITNAFLRNNSLYVAQKSSAILNSSIAWELHSVTSICQLSLLTINELSKRDQQAQVSLLLKMLQNYLSEEKIAHQKGLIIELFFKIGEAFNNERTGDEVTSSRLNKSVWIQLIEIAVRSKINLEILIGVLEELTLRTDFNAYPFYEFLLLIVEDYQRYRIQRIIRNAARHSQVKCKDAILQLNEWLPTNRAKKYNLNHAERFSLLFLGKLVSDFQVESVKYHGAWPSNHFLFSLPFKSREEECNFYRIALKWLFHPLLLEAIWDKREDKNINEFSQQLLDSEHYPDLIRSYTGYPDAQAIIYIFWKSGVKFDKIELNPDKPNTSSRAFIDHQKQVRKLLLTMELADIIASWFVTLLGDIPSRAHPEAWARWDNILTALITECSSAATTISLKNNGQGKIILADWTMESIILWHWDNYSVWEITRNGVNKQHTRELRNRFYQKKEQLSKLLLRKKTF